MKETENYYDVWVVTGGGKLIPSSIRESEVARINNSGGFNKVFEPPVVVALDEVYRHTIREEGVLDMLMAVNITPNDNLNN